MLNYCTYYNKQHEELTSSNYYLTDNYGNSSAHRSPSAEMIDVLAAMSESEVKTYLDALRAEAAQQRKDIEVNRQRNIQTKKDNLAFEKWNINVIRHLFESYTDLIDVKPEEIGAEFDFDPCSIQKSNTQPLTRYETGDADYLITLNMSALGVLTIDFKFAGLSCFKKQNIYQVINGMCKTSKNADAGDIDLDHEVVCAFGNIDFKWATAHDVDECMAQIKKIADFVKAKDALVKMLTIIKNENAKIAAEFHQAEIAYNIAKHKADTEYEDLGVKQLNKFFNMLNILREGA